MERPALQRLLTDIEARKVDCVVVYKVDRLSRSLLDFARILETFERHQVSFVSVTQQFNTDTSMGRLMLNVLLSFAQFEREMISKRTRDKMAAARRKGKYVGGRPTLGYDVVDTKLVVNQDEAERVGQAFELYLQHQALLPVVKELARRGRYGRQDLCPGEPAPTPLAGRVPRVARLMALAIRFDELLRRGLVKDQAELARLGHVSRARVTQIMNLLCLAPDIQEAVLFLPLTQCGRDPVTERHLRKLAAAPDWHTQRRLWQELVARTTLASGSEPNLVVNQNEPGRQRV